MATSRHGQKWSEEETTLAYYLYCQIPFSKIGDHHPDIIKLASLLGRTPASVALKLSNLAHFDPELQKRAIRGMSNASKTDALIFNRYKDSWEELVQTATDIYAQFGVEQSQETDQEVVFPAGTTVAQTVQGRRNQHFFRSAVLSSYQDRCCITGIALPSLLVASHIKPWAVSDPRTERTNPRNGLCLNCLHDKAFDKGYITVLPDLSIRVSSAILNDHSDGSIWLASCNGKQIEKPEKFEPSIELLQYHNDVIFIP